MNLCIVEDCKNRGTAKGLCNKHYLRQWRYGDALHKASRKVGCKRGYIEIKGEHGRRTFKHVHIAETAFGKRLPSGAVVHHADGDSTNNANNNLVICQDNAYHRLIHVRLAAWRATGNPNKRKCTYCKDWDNQDSLIHAQGGKAKSVTHYHLECKRKHGRDYWDMKKKVEEAGL